MTEYVVTRWYRAPEIMCSCEAYDYKIDVWSAGCILAELLMRNPIFPGDDYKQQLNLIFNVLGTPTKEDMACISNEFALQYIQSLPVRQKARFLFFFFFFRRRIFFSFFPSSSLSCLLSFVHPLLSSLSRSDWLHLSLYLDTILFWKLCRS